MARDLTGERFGKLVVTKNIPSFLDGTSWQCLCDCGIVCNMTRYKLVHGNRRSCGKCRHDMSQSPEYQVWRDMKSRCTNPNHQKWKDYGGRGITVCVEWMESFQAFYACMGERWPGRSIERIHNNGNYGPDNTCWATQSGQMKNTRRSKR